MKKSLEQRIEEAIREEISIVPYDPEWPQLYESEAVFLRSALPQSVIIKIEHFGSTAVPGLAAKPVIDVLVQVSSLEETREQIVPLLEAEGYDYFWRTDVRLLTPGLSNGIPKGSAPITSIWSRRIQSSGSGSTSAII